MAQLESLRSEIDRIDKQIIDLLNSRMTVSEKVGRLKKIMNKQVVDFAREDAIIKQLIAVNPGPLSDIILKAIYGEILSGSRSLQAREKIAFLGPVGTFSHEAAIARFGQSAQLLPCSTIADIFDEMNQNQSTYGIVPIENSIEGSIRETLDQLMTSSVIIIAELGLRISHSLMNISGKLEDVRKVVSHPQALAQCRGWLNKTLPSIPLLETLSTAKACEIAVEDAEAAAIGNECFGVSLELITARKAIQDKNENFTRFVILGRTPQAPTDNDKTSIVFWVEDKPGTLFSVLKDFADYGINLSRIESRPDKGINPWKYAFFVDLSGHRDDPNVSNCLKEVGKSATHVKILGSYPVHDQSQEIS